MPIVKAELIAAPCHRCLFIDVVVVMKSYRNYELFTSIETNKQTKTPARINTETQKRPMIAQQRKNTQNDLVMSSVRLPLFKRELGE